MTSYIENEDDYGTVFSQVEKDKDNQSRESTYQGASPPRNRLQDRRRWECSSRSRPGRGHLAQECCPFLTNNTVSCIGNFLFFVKQHTSKFTKVVFTRDSDVKLRKFEII